MRPDKIILVRHGESMGNVDKQVYLETPDYAVRLTEQGKEQALILGERLRVLMDSLDAAHNEKPKYYQFHDTATGKILTPSQRGAMVYGSPYFRTRETYKQFRKSIAIHKYYEDPRLREQEWGTRTQENFDELQRLRQAHIEQTRDAYGTFYYRFEGGESVADVYDRASSFLDTLWRDFEKDDYPSMCIINTHGMFVRAFLMRFLHLTVEEFEVLKNPKNASMTVLSLVGGKYKLDEPLPKWERPVHDWCFDWNE